MSSTSTKIDGVLIAESSTTGSTYFVPLTAQGGLSGSLQQLANGSSYLVAGANVTITSQSNGQVFIDAATSGSSGGLSPHIAVYTGSFYWTCPAGCTLLKLTMWGGGGGGGGSTGVSAAWSAGGGGAGAFASTALVTVTPGTVYTGSAGAGGAAGSSSTSTDGSDGSQGSASTFVGGTVSLTSFAGGMGGQHNHSDVNGGPGGAGVPSGLGAAGGVGAGYAFGNPPAAGSQSLQAYPGGNVSSYTYNSILPGGGGGGGPQGPGGDGGSSTSTPATPAAGSGAGGGGAYVQTSSPYISQPAPGACGGFILEWIA